MVLQDKIDIFINKAQTKITELSLKVAEDLYEGYGDDTHAVLANELSDVIASLQSEQLDWIDYEVELALDYYNYKAELSDIALINYADIITRISDNGTVVDSGWIDAFNSLQSTVVLNKQATDSSIDDLQNQIDNMDLSGLIPQELLDDIDDLKEDSHTHNNKSVLDGLTQSHVDSIGLNNDHRLNSSIHVTNTQKDSWNAKPTQQQLTDGLSGKSDVNHTHQISDVEGLAEALEVIEPEKGDKGDKGDTPIFSVGTVEIGEELQIDVDVSIPELPILNFTVPVGEDGKDFKIDVYGNASDRLKSLYNNEPLGFNYLGTDTGLLYIRKPLAEDGVTPIPATTTSGWYQVKFAGDSGWSPILGSQIVDDTTTVLKVAGWVGGTGNPPELGSDPNYPVYIGQYGLTYRLVEATNVKGAQGISGPPGKIMFPDQTDTFENRYLYDSESRDFIFLDSVNGVIYRKLSESVGDWSEGFQWKGDQGSVGPPGPAGGIAVPVFSDSEFKITGSLDDTKVARFQNENITTDTERVFEFPDKNGTFALLDDVNKYTESATPPDSPKNGDRWLNTVNGIEYTWFGDETWISL